MSNHSCTGLSYESSTPAAIPSNDTIGIATYQSHNRSQPAESDYLWQLMDRCCGSNPVGKVQDDCVLWCDLPQQYVDDHDAWLECVDRKNLSVGWTTVWDGEGQGNGGVVVGGRPGVLGWAGLAVVVGWFCLLA